MTPGAEREIADDLGLSELPPPRYGDIPKEMASPEELGEVMRFKKALTLVDPIATAAFSRFIPNQMIVDQGIDARGWSRGYSFAVQIRTDKPPVVNRKVTAATGITKELNERNFYAQIALRMYQLYVEMGAHCVSPPLIFRTTVKDRRTGARPLIGAIFKFGRVPRDGSLLESIQSGWGLLHDAALETKTRKLPVVEKVQMPGASPLVLVK